MTMEPHTRKYALLKKAFYLCPPLSLIIKNSYRVFKLVDKAMNIKSMQKVSRKEVFIWQYSQLEALMDKVGMEKG